MSDQTEFNLTGNQITLAGKVWGGMLLLSFTVAAILSLIAFWPDKIPDVKYPGDSKYVFKLFEMRLIEKGTAADSARRSSSANDTAGKKTIPQKTNDSPNVVINQRPVLPTDSLQNKSADSPQHGSPPSNGTVCCRETECDTIDLNTIYLVLV